MLADRFSPSSSASSSSASSSASSSSSLLLLLLLRTEIVQKIWRFATTFCDILHQKRCDTPQIVRGLNLIPLRIRQEKCDFCAIFLRFWKHVGRVDKGDVFKCEGPPFDSCVWHFWVSVAHWKKLKCKNINVKVPRSSPGSDIFYSFWLTDIKAQHFGLISGKPWVRVPDVTSLNWVAQWKNSTF